MAFPEIAPLCTVINVNQIPVIVVVPTPSTKTQERMPAKVSQASVRTVFLPVTRSSSTYTTILNLSKPTSTATNDDGSSNGSGLSKNSIGAIIGSILGFIVIILLVYCCCVRQAEYNVYEDSLSDNLPPSSTRPQKFKAPGSFLQSNVHLRRNEEGAFEYQRPPQRREAVLMH